MCYCFFFTQQEPSSPLPSPCNGKIETEKLNNNIENLINTQIVVYLTQSFTRTSA